MGVGNYTQKMPDLGKNDALAGKTVYDCGLNVTRGEDGYVVEAVNPNHEKYKGTTKSIKAQPVADALAGLPWEEPSHDGLIEWNPGTCG